MKKKFTFLIAAIALLSFLAIPMGMRGQVVSGTAYNTTSSSDFPSGWTYDGEFATGNSPYFKLVASTNYIQTSEFGQNGFTSIKLKARKFGGPSADEALITVSWYYNNNETVLGTIAPTSTTLTDYTISSPTNPTGNTTGYLKIQCKGASGSKGSGVSAVTITYTASGSTPTYTVIYDCNGGTSGCPDPTTITGISAGNSITLADAPSKTGNDFTGWSDGTNTYNAGASYQVNSNVTFTAQWTPTGGSGSEEHWVATNLADLTTSDVFVIVGNNGSNYAMSNNNGTTSAPSAVAVTVTGEEITSDVAATIQWNISGNATDGYTFYPNGSTTTWLYCTNANNGIRVGTNTDNTFNLHSSGYLQHDVTSRFVGIYSSQDWRCYTEYTTNNIKDQTFAFYKKVTGGVIPPSISADNVNILYDATSGSIGYTINNEPTPAGTMTASVDASGTIANLALGTITSGTVPFTCDANTTGTARSATVTLTYTYNSTETVTKDVTITQAAAPVIYNTIPDMFAAATSTATNVNVAFDDWIVTGVSTNGKNVFVTDGTNGFAIYNSGGNLGETYAVGNILSGTTTASLKMQNGYAQLTDVVATNLTITSGGSVAFANIPMADLAGVNTGALVHYDNLTCSVTSGKYYLSDGTTTLQVYNSLYAFGALENGKIYNISGVYQQYNTTKEVLPRSAADIEEVVVSTPTITLNTYEIEATSAGASGTINATYTMIEITAGLDIIWYESDGVTPATYNWVMADFDTDNNVEYIIDANDGAARSAYFKVYGIDAGTNDVYSNLVTINQEAYVVTTYTVTYAANGGTGTMTDPNSPYVAGVEVTLLANTFTAPEGMMWDSWEVKDADNQDVTVNGDKFNMPASNVTVTAQWVVDPNAQQYEWVLTNIANLTSSDVFVIVGTRNNTTYYGMSNDNGTSTQPSAVEVTIANNKLSAVPAANIKWNISGDNTDGYIFYPNGDADAWLYCNTTAGSSSNTNMRVGTGDRKLFVLDDNNYLVTNDSYTDRYVSLNGSTDWRGYVNTNQATTITFYKRQIASTDPALYTDDVDIASDATAGEITYTLENPVTGGNLTAEITAGNDGNWLTLGTIGASVPFTCSANTDATARTATVTLTYTYNTTETVTATAVVTQAAYIVDYATLPFAFDGGKNDIESTNGLTQEGLDSDYNASPLLKFKNAGTWVILKLNEAPTSLSYDIKGNSFSGGTFDVLTSVDGVTYESLATYTELGATQSITHINLASTVRYIKWVYTTKSSGNVALGNIHASTNYDIYGTVSVDHLNIPSDKVCTIYSGATLNIGMNGLSNEGNATNLIIKDGGQLKTPNEVYATVEKTITGYGLDNAQTNKGYYLVSAPAAKYLYVDKNNKDVDAFKFDAFQQGEEWQNFKTATGAWHVSASTAVLYASKNDCTLSLDGYGIVYNTQGGQPVNNKVPATDDNINVPVQFNSGKAFEGWNLIGNPYTCKAYLAGNRTFYRMNANRDGFITGTGAIDVCEGVFVETTSGELEVAFTTTAPVTNAGNNSMINISLNQMVNRGEQTLVDNALIRFGEGNTMHKFSFSDNTAKVYIPQNGKDFAVVNADAQGEMPVNFKAAKTGTYTISVETENLDVTYLHLIDNLTGMDVDLLQTPSYTFEGKKSDYASRFRLVFSTNSTNENDSDNFGFISDGQLILTGLTGGETLQVIDALGRVITSTNAFNHISTENMAPGVYVLRLINGNDVKTQKIVVR